MPRTRFELVFYETRRYTKIVRAKSEEGARLQASQVEDTDDLVEDNEYYELELTDVTQLEPTEPEED